MFGGDVVVVVYAWRMNGTFFRATFYWREILCLQHSSAYTNHSANKLVWVFDINIVKGINFFHVFFTCLFFGINTLYRARNSYAFSLYPLVFFSHFIFISHGVAMRRCFAYANHVLVHTLSLFVFSPWHR